MKAFLQELAEFGADVIRRWKVLLTSGALPAGLLLAQAWGKQMPGGLVRAVVFAYLLFAAFLGWREQRRKRIAAESAGADLERRLHASTEEPESLTMEVPGDEYWLLTMVAKYGLRRQLLNDRRGASSNSLWLDEKPIDYYDSRWFYDLVNATLQRGNLIVPPGQLQVQVHRLAPEAERVLEAGRRKRREVKRPSGALINAVTGAEETGF